MKTSTPTFTAEQLLGYYLLWQTADSESAREIVVNEATAIAVKEAQRLGADEDQTQNAVEAAILAVLEPTSTENLPKLARLAARYAVLRSWPTDPEESNVCLAYDEQSQDDPEQDAFYIQLRDAINSLPSEDAFLLNAYYGFGGRQLSVQEIAERLTITRSGVHKRLNDLIKKLARRFNGNV